MARANPDHEGTKPKRAPRARVVAAAGLALALAAVAAPGLAARFRPAAVPGEVATDQLGVDFHVPADWPPGQPLPAIVTNCVRCHIDKGGEISRSVYEFAGGVHDTGVLSCNQCHGGNVRNDETAHEGDFISGKLSALMNRCGYCHRNQERRFKNGNHYSETIRWDFPTCSNCHDNHSTGKGFKRMETVCNSCHGAKATATTGAGESGIEWTSALAGEKGNRTRVEMRAAGPNRPLKLAWSEDDAGGVSVVVDLATDGSGRAVSTAEDVLNAMRADPELHFRVQAREVADSFGEGVVAPASFELHGGAGFDSIYPLYGDYIRAGDALWNALGRLRAAGLTPVGELKEDIDRARGHAMRMTHAVPENPGEVEIRVLTKRKRDLAARIEAHLLAAGEAAPAAAAPAAPAP